MPRCHTHLGSGWPFALQWCKSSTPLSNIVSLYPLLARHDWHVLMSASGPLYHSFTLFSQPTTVLQYLLIMIGGVTGTKRWYLHFSASRNNQCRPSGILASLFRVNISLIAFLSSPTSSMSTFSFFSRTLYPESFGFGLVCTSQHCHLSQWLNGVTSEILVCYLQYPFLKQHMFFGAGISKMQFLPTHKSKYKKHPCILIMVVM